MSKIRQKCYATRPLGRRRTPGADLPSIARHPGLRVYLQGAGVPNPQPRRSVPRLPRLQHNVALLLVDATAS